MEKGCRPCFLIKGDEEAKAVVGRSKDKLFFRVDLSVCFHHSVSCLLQVNFVECVVHGVFNAPLWIILASQHDACMSAKPGIDRNIIPFFTTSKMLVGS